MPRQKKLSRLILNFPGFEPTRAMRQIDRLTYGGHKTAALWEFDLERLDAVEVPEEHKATANFASSGEGWEASVRYVQFSWQDIISRYEDSAYPKSFFENFPKFLSFFWDGSVGRYFKASKRYWGFTIYPLLYLIVAGIAAWFLGSIAATYLSLGWIWSLPIAFLLFFIFGKYPGDWIYVNLSINDWGFARDMCNQSNQEIEKRYEDFADCILEEIQNSSHDEILVVGHSFGAVWAVTALAKAFEKKPKLIKNKNVTFLALGSSLLKIALVPEAKFLRNYIRDITSQKSIFWHEIQTKTDFISFYKADPLEQLGITDPACGFQIHRVNFSRALDKVRLRKMRKSMYLAHRQYILYADKRVAFDFQFRCFGQFFARDLALNSKWIESYPESVDAIKSLK